MFILHEITEIIYDTVYQSILKMRDHIDNIPFVHIQRYVSIPAVTDQRPKNTILHV